MNDTVTQLARICRQQETACALLHTENAEEMLRRCQAAVQSAEPLRCQVCLTILARVGAKRMQTCGLTLFNLNLLTQILSVTDDTPEAMRQITPRTRKQKR